MSVLYTSSYVINRNDLNYIRAITKYNKEANITEIDGVERQDKPYCNHLPKLMTHSKKETTTIICRSVNSNSTREAFPAIDVKEIQTLIGSNPLIQSLEESTADVMKEIEGVLSAHYDRRDPEFLALLDPSWKLEINKIQALFVIKKLQANSNVLGAINLPDLNTIIFQFDTTSRHGVVNFALDYSKTSPGLSELDIFGLDLDDGFYVSGAKSPSPLMNALNAAFIEWKNSHYTGALFKSFTAPSQQQKVERTLSSNSLFNSEPSVAHSSGKGPAVKQRIGL